MQLIVQKLRAIKHRSCSATCTTDAAGALAMFIASHWTAYRNVELPDSHCLSLVRQMRPALGTSADFQQATHLAKQIMFEQLVILGLSMTLAAQDPKRDTDPSNRSQVRHMAHQVLQ